MKNMYGRLTGKLLTTHNSLYYFQHLTCSHEISENNIIILKLKGKINHEVIPQRAIFKLHFFGFSYQNHLSRAKKN